MTETRIARLRRERGWTQQRLASESRLGVRTIQRLEAGSDASLQTLELVAAALGVPVSGLFVAERSEPPAARRPGRVQRAASLLRAGLRLRLRRIAGAGAVVLVLALAGAAVGTAVALGRPPVYQATARVYVELPAATTPGYAASVLTSYANVADSPYVLLPVQDRIGDGRTERQFAAAVSATVQPGAPVLAVTVRAASPALAARAADAVAQRLAASVPALTPNGRPAPHLTPIGRAAATGVRSVVLGVVLGLTGGVVAGVLVAAVLAFLRGRRPPSSGSAVGRAALA